MRPGGDDGKAPTAIHYENARAVFDALNDHGFGCTSPDDLSFVYESVGPVDALECSFDDGEQTLLIGVFETAQPSVELSMDFADDQVVGPNWLIAVSDANPSEGIERVIDAIGGTVVTDREAFPESPELAAGPVESDLTSTTRAPATTAEESDDRQPVSDSDGTESPTVTSLDDCPTNYTEKVGPADAAMCLYLAYRAGDDSVRPYAEAEAIQAMFASGPWDGTEWEGPTCGEPDYFTCVMFIPDDFHGVGVEMTASGGASAGYSISSVEFYG